MRTPTIIQGGMGVGVSSWQLAREVSLAGELGVVSGTALDAVLARKLQDGDPGGHVRRALEHFPSPAMVDRVMKKYYCAGGLSPGTPYRPHPMLSIDPKDEVIDLSLLGNFVEVWLAKEGHDGVVGINLLEKIQMANPSAALGAMLADIDYVLMGAGIPREIPRLLTDFAAHQPGGLTIDIEDATRKHRSVLDPVAALGADLPPLRRPKFLAIVSLHVLANYLNRDDEIRPDGFVVEGPAAGGHSAPPRGKVNLDDDGQPVYTDKDLADIAKMADIGLPFWMAGAYNTPAQVAAVKQAGAAGIQVGTLFALSEESGLRPDLRHRLMDNLRTETLIVRNDPRASPTGFPFKVATLPGTLSEHHVYEQRDRICDLGYLRIGYEKSDGRLGYRCASEPLHMFAKKGGDEADTVGRKCLCNALMADIGMGQTRKGGYVEQPAVTLGQDLTGPRQLLALHPDGWTARTVVEWLLSDVPTEQTKAWHADVRERSSDRV
ncbi:MAG: 2-nitropropane dioxygenase [Micrococcales bacterium]|nr:MAG: 2-nitropropane dioxygenase [Micrococcales bacterium]PIE25990.1 MAG: 2-nitropropane dioxygenase [Micrococcales bacterium]